MGEAWKAPLGELGFHWMFITYDMIYCFAGTCILFGDGCGAVVMTAAPEGEPCCLLGLDMHSDGQVGGWLAREWVGAYCPIMGRHGQAGDHPQVPPARSSAMGQLSQMESGLLHNA